MSIIIGSRAYQPFHVGAVTNPTESPEEPPSAAGAAISAVGQGFFAYMLFKPLGFATQHPIWGTLFLLGSISSAAIAASRATSGT